MSFSCFINSPRRFIALRGPVKILQSDRGPNFVRAADCIGLTCNDASRTSKLWGIWPLNLAKRGHLKLRRGHCNKYYFLYIEVINWLKKSFLNPLLFK